MRWGIIYLINEVLEVQGYLNGENINKKCLYRICFLLAKWFKQQGMSHIEIRQAIFDWGKKYHVYIEYNLNSIIYQALEDKQRLKDNIVIKITEIKNRFDTKNTRLTALAMLCIAKGYADRDREFQVSIIALSVWLNISNTHLSGIYIKELVDFDYLEKINSEKIFSWNKKTKSKHVRYKIKVPLFNNGTYELVNNDIHRLYSEIFV